MHQYIPYLCIGMNTYLIHAENIIYMCMYVCMYVYVYVLKNKLDKIAKTVDGILT